jgi:uncharacterized membrane protein (DUF4010 family)
MYNLSELADYSIEQWLTYIDPVTYDFIEKFCLSLLIGLLIGIERERKSDSEDIFAGVRTFTIASISGMVATYIAIQQGIPEILYLTMVFFIIVATVIIYTKNVVYHQIGITGGVALFFVFLMGILVAYDYYLFAIIGAVAITFLLVEKNTLKNFAVNLNQDEITNAVQFLVIIFILYPITPNTTIMEVINPRYILGIVVIVASMSFISFLLMKKTGPERGIHISGLIGGLVNSEATTAALAAIAKKKHILMNVSYHGIILSNATMLIRNMVIAFIVDPSGRVLIMMLPPQLLLTAVNIGMVVKDKQIHNMKYEALEIESPFALKPAFKFAFGFTVLIILAHYLNIWFGSAGVFVVALGGLVSSAAVTASVGALAFGGHLTPTVAAFVAVLASIISTSNKILLVRLVGSTELYDKIKRSFLILMSVGAVAFLLWILVQPILGSL